MLESPVTQTLIESQKIAIRIQYKEVKLSVLAFVIPVPALFNRSA
jgi:hypothetical protein